MFQLSQKLLNGRNITGHGCLQKVIVQWLPMEVLFELIRPLGATVIVPFNGSLGLSLQEAIKIMPVGSLVVLHSQQIVECGLGKGNALVHGIEVGGIHGRHQRADQVEPNRKWEGLALILVNFVGFVIEVITLGTVASGEEDDVNASFEEDDTTQGTHVTYLMTAERKMM